MSSRERWIVYPLLFLTLGIALREKVVPPRQLQVSEVSARQIRCEQLQVDKMICNDAQIGQTAQIRQIICDRVESNHSMCRSLLVNGSNGRPVVVAGMDPCSHNGLVEVLSAKQSPLVELQSTEGGGMVTTVDYMGKTVVMGYLGKNFGVFAYVPETGLIIPLTQPWRFKSKSAVPLSPEGQPSASAPTKQGAEKKESEKKAMPHAEGGK